MQHAYRRWLLGDLRGRYRRQQPVDRAVTLAWGLAYLAEASARALMAWTLPTGIVLIASTSAPPALGVQDAADRRLGAERRLALRHA